ncbi:MAG: PfkB family carbohydrate kinase, partial [Acidobacteriota bacterium]
MRHWGMGTSGIQVDRKHPTGIVKVIMNQGDPSYEVVQDRAWDFIQADPAIEAIGSQSFSMLYHGSLAARSRTSCQTLASIRKKVNAPVFIDVNLRPPHWNRDLIKKLLSGASWIKLNHSELQLVIESSSDPAQAAMDLLNTHGAEWVITTRGAEGADITSGRFGTLQQEPPAINGFVDTVGAGDAFSALVIYGLAAQWTPAVILERAVEFAADICKIQGATTNNKALYTNRLEQWESTGD